jgi:methylenetetrahydrofolate reductase (NADPH)
MQFMRDIYAAKKAARQPVVSFEFYPPKTDEGEHALLERHIPALREARPDFCSVTYGAGGGTRDKTLKIVDCIQRRHNLTALAHLTCANHTRDEVCALLEKISALGCKNILALRGDPPGGGDFQVTPGGFEFCLNSSDSSASRMDFPSGSPVFLKAISPINPASMTTGGI